MLETVTIRAGALRSISGRSRLVSRKAPRWFTANVRSMPSPVTSRLTLADPALFTRMWSAGQLAITFAASVRI